MYLGKEYDGEILLNGSVIVCDPAYISEDWGTIHLELLPGSYRCYKQKYLNDTLQNPLISDLYICHKDYDAEAFDLLDSMVSVDSGQCGIFDSKMVIPKGICTIEQIPNPDYIPFKNSPYYIDDEELYYQQRALYAQDALISPEFLERKTAKRIEGHGYISSSGFGDGIYNCLVGKVDEKIVSVRVSFIPTDEEFHLWNS